MASYFQSYFQASSMPKRLLQYALSRLEILDTDALDLDALDIAWGKKCIFEFKDVGLRLKKLESLLQLPPSFETVKARVLLLRLTIPVDIYSSPIVVEVDGVECQLRVKEPNGRSAHHNNHDRNRKRTHPLDTRRGPTSKSDNGVGPAIPNAVDLAQSFLQTEPEEERVELEAAILSETHELGSSSSDDGESEGVMGTGTALSLPAFMARFLTGIMDRLQVKIRGVTLTLDIELPSETPRSPIASTDTATVQLGIEDVDIQGVTLDLERVSTAAGAKFPYKTGTRLIRLSKIRGALIAEADTFSSRSRSSAIPSPSATHSDWFEGRKLPLRMHPSQRGSESQPSDSAVSPGRSSVASSGRLAAKFPPKTSDYSPSVRGSAIISDNGRFDDAPEDEVDTDLRKSFNGGLNSEVGDDMLEHSVYLDQVSESQYLPQDELEDGRTTPSLFAEGYHSTMSSRSPLSTSKPLIHASGSIQDDDRDFFESHHTAEEENSMMLQSSILSTRQRSRFSQERISKSQTSFPGERSSPPSAAIETIDSDGSDDDLYSASPVRGDLIQSQVFSHEDAESMYMSAVSYGSPPERIPGGWARSSSGSESPEPAARSTTLQNLQEIPRDNLEHARRTSPIQTSPNITGISQILEPVAQPPDISEVAPESHSTPTSNQHVPSLPQASSGASERSTTFSDDYHRVTKRIFDIDEVAIYVPGATKNEAPELPDAATNSVIFSGKFDGQSETSRSTSINIPGAFSTHLDSGTTPTTHAPPTVEPEIKGAEDAETRVEVEVGQVSAQVNVSAGLLIWRLINRLKASLKQESSTPPPQRSEPTSSRMDLQLGAEEISLMFLERLEGSLRPITSESDAMPWEEPAEANILLRTTLQNLRVSTQSSESKGETSITLGKFAFGYAKEDIVSFDPDLRMRTSVRDLKASAGIDVSVDIFTTADSSRFDIKTLPMHVSIDLQRLDETFSWFGGLSSVLNLGSSIASSATVTTTSPTRTKPRGVRFEVPISPDDKSPARNKIDIRVGGFVLDLVGTECSVGVETSAIKIVGRNEGIGVGVQKIRLSGPHLKNSIEDPAIDVEVTAVRIEYLPSPKDADLDALLSLITPSKAKYDQDDDILLDTLLRQRKQGAVLRLTIDDAQARISRLDELRYLPDLGEEVSRLSTVAKYLPDDDRPGLLTLLTLKKFDAQVDIGDTFGTVQLATKAIEVAQITFPALLAFSVNAVSLRRNGTEELIGPVTDSESRELRSRAPAIMARLIGDEMEPIVKIKLWNIKLEYRVPTLLAIFDLTKDTPAEAVSASLAASVATLTDLARTTVLGVGSKKAARIEKSNSSSKPVTVDLVLRDCVLGLNPLGLSSKVLVVLTETHLSAVLPRNGELSASAEMGKGSLLVIDDVANIGRSVASPRRQSFDGGNSQVTELCATGFVSVGYISSAKATVRISTDRDGEQSIDVELRDDLFVLESCADSTQTLIAVINGLTPPIPPSNDMKYRTTIIPVDDLLSSLSGDAFGVAEGEYNFDDDFDISGEEDLGEDPETFEFDSHYYRLENTGLKDQAASSSSTRIRTRDTRDGVLLESFIEPEEEVDENAELDFQEDHFGSGSVLEGTAHRWNSARNAYDKSNVKRVRKSPLKICVRDVHIIWNLFDGYDWQRTRDTISQAVQDVEFKASERRTRNERRPVFEQDIEDEETEIGDFLFNSIYIGIPSNKDPRDLSAAINQNLNDNATETESVATTRVSTSPNRQAGFRGNKAKRLRLKRSKHHKITFELRGVCADFIAFPPHSGETQSSVDVRVRDFEIFDHIPTSTWRKFATYMDDAGERETGSNMIHLEVLNVKPVPDLAASEIVLRVTVLPLRLHVDQDALDFITRYFEFKDDSALNHAPPSDPPFLQRVEVNSVQVKLDFKPKRVDYAGLRSGHTTEFMNFVILDEADMVLRHTIIYGISGTDKLNKTLNDVWMPDIINNQLPGVLAGIAPMRPIVNVGGGFRHLLVVPVDQYRKDGRIMRGVAKGAAAFAKTTGTELVKLGAKVAIGMQTALQGAEGMLSPAEERLRSASDDEDGGEERNKISPYANQPLGVLQGLRGGYNGLQRDLVLARDAIIAVPGEVMEGGSAAGVLRAVRKHAPTVILRPAIGVAKAGGQILMGATNTLDPKNLQRVDNKYKKH